MKNEISHSSCFQEKAIVKTDKIGGGTQIWAFVHILIGVVIGRNCNIGDHCYIGMAIEGL
ncbi:MAG: hypothetical protein BA865_03170 [Desulfobacterales bacterium S5133MH4]|nr:MAG: hypothetical protein BA865_03170 [Desulfobacterales bacterium S5133MH4]